MHGTNDKTERCISSNKFNLLDTQYNYLQGLLELKMGLIELFERENNLWNFIELTRKTRELVEIEKTSKHPAIHFTLIFFTL